MDPLCRWDDEMFWVDEYYYWLDDCVVPDIYYGVLAKPGQSIAKNPYPGG